MVYIPLLSRNAVPISQRTTYPPFVNIYTHNHTYVSLLLYCLCIPLLCSFFPSLCLFWFSLPFVYFLSLRALTISFCWYVQYYAVPCYAVLYGLIWLKRNRGKFTFHEMNAQRYSEWSHSTPLVSSIWENESSTKPTVCNVNNIMVGPKVELLRRMASSFFDSPKKSIDSKCLRVARYIWQYGIHM